MSINANAQLLNTRLSINLGPGSLDSCLLQLEQATKFSFAYETSGLQSLTVRKKSFEQERLSDILHYLLKGSGYLFEEKYNSIIIGPDITDNIPELLGIIEDKNTGKRIEGVVIYNMGNRLSHTITDKDGRFSLAAVSDTMRLSLHYLGYKPVEVILNPLKTPAVCIKIEMDQRELDTIMVVRSTDILPYSALSRLSLSVNEIASLPAFCGNADLLGLAKISPGIQEANDGSGNLIVRGGAPDQNLLLLDDANIYGETHLFGLLSSVNSLAVKNISIYKGSFPARFGGRISSVWDINTKNGDAEHIHGSLSLGTMAASFMIEGPVLKNKTSFLISGRRSYHDHYLRLFTPGISFYFQDLNIKICHRLSEKDQLSFTFYKSEDKFQLPNEVIETDPLSTITQQEILLSSVNSAAVFKWQHYYSAPISTNLSLVYSGFNRISGDQQRITFPADTASWLQSKEQIQNGLSDWSVKFNARYITGQHNNLEAGIYYTQHQFRPHTITSELTSDSAQSTFMPPYVSESKIEDKVAHETGFFLEDRLTIIRKLTVSAGVHFNKYFYGSRSYSSIQPRLNVRYQLGPSSFLHAAYVRMQQSLHRLSISQTSLPIDFWIPSTGVIKPQLSDQLSFGLSTKLLGSKLNLSVEAYYKNIKNVPEYLVFGNVDTSLPSQSPSWDQVITTGRGTAYGLEFSICKSQGSFKNWLSYALSWSTRTLPEVNEGATFPYKYDRRHSLNLVSVYKLSKSFELSAIFSFQSKPQPPVLIIKSADKSNNATELEKLASLTQLAAYHRLDLGISWLLKYRNGINANLKFNVLNIYNRANAFFYFSNEHNGRLPGTTLLPISPSLSYTLTF